MFLDKFGFRLCEFTPCRASENHLKWVKNLWFTLRMVGLDITPGWLKQGPKPCGPYIPACIPAYIRIHVFPSNYLKHHCAGDISQYIPMWYPHRMVKTMNPVFIPILLKSEANTYPDLHMVVWNIWIPIKHHQTSSTIIKHHQTSSNIINPDDSPVDWYLPWFHPSQTHPRFPSRPGHGRRM